MAKSYINQTNGTDALYKARVITVAAPFDVRTVVDTYEDLLSKEVFSYSELYVGLLVVTKDTQDVYVLAELPGKRDNAEAWRENIRWKQIGDNEFNPADYLNYFENKLGAKILNSADDLVTIIEPFAGQFAVVKDNPYTSEDESGLYVYTGQSWMRIYTSSDNSGSGPVDLSSVITTNGTMPTSGSGFSVTGNDPNALVEETYVDDYLHAGVYYSCHGINSTKDNGGSELDGVGYITLSNGTSSWIKIYINGNLKLNIVDDSLGFNNENIVGIIVSNGTEYTNPYAGHPYSSPGATLHLDDGMYIKFNKDIDFTGLTETRDEDPTEYIFGQTGSNYNDIDFYSTKVLPTVYAYANSDAVRVLTEGDKVEMVNMIEASAVESISNEEILGIF